MYIILVNFNMGCIMKLIVCISEDFGISFNARRVSKDSALCQDVIEMVGTGTLRVHSYSAKLFSDYPQVLVSDDYLNEAKAGDYCFYEKGELDPTKVEEIVLYNWNRAYPSDLKLQDIIDITEFNLGDCRDFAGSSHDNITCEIYKRG